MDARVSPLSVLLQLSLTGGGGEKDTSEALKSSYEGTNGLKRSATDLKLWGSGFSAFFCMSL